MMQFIPYAAEHLSQIALQPAQEPWRDFLQREDYARALVIAGMSWTGLCDGVLVGAAGFVPQWEGRVIAWALFGRVPTLAWPGIVRKVRRELRVLQAHGRHRVEVTVPSTFGPGCRLAVMLGFRVEGRMREYGPDGADHLLYAQVLPCA